MSIFGKIMGAIFGTKADAAPAGGGRLRARDRPLDRRADRQQRRPRLSTSHRSWTRRLPPRARSWRGVHSIVDLMKALDIDSSFTARKELAKELGYTGDSNDSASMNIWLHKQVMTKLAANGGVLPPDLKD